MRPPPAAPNAVENRPGAAGVAAFARYYGAAMRLLLQRLTETATGLILRFPWAGWAGWIAFCIIALARVAPRRFESTFTVYIDAAKRLWAQGPVYELHSLGGYFYLPAGLLVYAPFTSMPSCLAAGFWLAVFAAVFTWGCCALMACLLPQGANGIRAWSLAGVLLLINIPAAWFNFKGVQSQIIMAGAMLLAAAAIMRARWLWATLWLFVAIVFKPLALVMALLCGALRARMRLPLLVALAAIIALPFVFFDAGYLVQQYRDFFIKLWLTAAAPPEDWPFRADLVTLLSAFGIGLSPLVALALRVIAGLGTLYLAWRVRQTGTLRSFGFALLILSCCYINLFTPRNEYLSFVLLTPSLAALALLVLARDGGDGRGWLLIVAALVLDMWWSLAVDAVLKPAIVVVIYGWLGWLMAKPERWCALADAGHPDSASLKLQPAR
jgi:alpha-1,2-mannosyltransferase